MSLTYFLIFLNVAPATPTATSTYVWFNERDFSCQSQSGKDTSLPIGQDGRYFDVGVTVEYCKETCAKSLLCQGFDYQDIPGPQPPVCRYKGQIDTDKLTRERGTSCYIYERPSVVPLTVGTTVKPTTMIGWSKMKGVDCVTMLDSALRIGESLDYDGSSRRSFDAWSPERCRQKCAKYTECEGFNYDNDLGICRYKKAMSHTRTIPKRTHDCWIHDRHVGSTIDKKTTVPSTVARATASTFQFSWLEEPNHDCASTSLDQNLKIGDTLSPSGARRTYDVASVDYCKRKCAMYAKCAGFNYEFPMGMCRYKSDLTVSRLLPNEDNSCYLYLRTPAALLTTTQQPATTRQPTPPASQKDKLQSWLHEGIDILANSIFGHQGGDAPVVVHGRNLRGDA